MIRGVLVVLSIGMAVGVASGCADPAAPRPTGELTVFAAASLGTALEEIESVYEAARDIDLVISTDSSAALATQIEQGAPADVFLSADMAQAQRLVDGGLAAAAIVPFASNHLIVVVPEGDPAGVKTLAALGRPGVRVIAAGDTVPITRYAMDLVTNLSSLSGYPDDFAGAYERNIVSREDSVAAVLTKIELAEGDAAIVYATDAVRSTAVWQVEVPDAVNVRATYGGVALATSDSQRDGAAREGAARAFLDWLAEGDGRAVLAGFGFLPPPT